MKDLLDQRLFEVEIDCNESFCGKSGQNWWGMSLNLVEQGSTFT